MLRNLFRKTFEQTKTDTLPSHIQKLVVNTSKEFNRRHKTTDPVLQRKILGLAHTTLHMRIYQRFGAQSNDIMSSAYADLRQRMTIGQLN